MGIPLDGVEIFEHSKNGYTLRIEGKYANPKKDTSGILSVANAFIALDADNPNWIGNEKWAWENTDWEHALKEESGNPDTSYFPLASAKLLWVLDNYKTPSYEIPDSCIRLAWRFELFCLDPFFIRHYYVDAHTGVVFDYDELINNDGIADIHTYGDRLIDTKARNRPYNDYILKANGNNRKIHTKYFHNDEVVANNNEVPFFLSNEIVDYNDEWHTNHQNATSVHWMLSRA